MDDLVKLLEETGSLLPMTTLRKGNPPILRSSATFCPRAITFPQTGRFI